MAEEYGQYLYLRLEDAKVKVFNTYKSLNISPNFGTEMRRINNSTWNKLPAYAKERSQQFESMLKGIMSNTSYSTGGKGAAQITSAIKIGDLSGAASYISRIRTDAKLLKEAVKQLNTTLNELDKADEYFSQNILTLALSDPYIKQMLQIVIPDGIYSVDPSSFRVNDSIQKALCTAREKAAKIIQLTGSMSCGVTVGSSADTEIKALLQAIENVISSNRGFLYEVELLEGFLKSVKEGNTAVAYKGAVGKVKNDPKLENDKKQADKLLSQLNSIVSSIGVANPKADLICSINENGVVSIFGISIKSISPTRFAAIQEGKGAHKYSIHFGSTYKTLKQIFDKHGSIISQQIGGYDPVWYGAQILTGWEDSHKPGDTTTVDGGGGEYTAAWNRILDMAAMLNFSDALIGIGEKTLQGGFATYLVVNNQVYWMKNVLNKTALAVEKGQVSGIYGHTTTTLNRRWGQELQNRSYVSDFTGSAKTSAIRAAALQRSNAIWDEWNAQMQAQTLKVDMSLGALKTIADRAGLMPIF